MIEGIIIVDLPTWFNHEQKKNNASRGYRCEHDKNCFHDVYSPKRLQERFTPP
jgi:hypothetical protein